MNLRTKLDESLVTVVTQHLFELKFRGGQHLLFDDEIFVLNSPSTKLLYHVHKLVLHILDAFKFLRVLLLFLFIWALVKQTTE